MADMTFLLLIIAATAIIFFALGWQSGTSREREIARMDRIFRR